MSESEFVTFDGIVPRKYGVEFKSKVDWHINRGEQWAVVGLNGSGKTMLAEMLLGRIATSGNKIKYVFFDSKSEDVKLSTLPFDCIKKVSFESAYSFSDYKNMCFQQRFNSSECEESPTVEEVMLKEKPTEAELEFLTHRLRLEPLMHKRTVMLSSGELRRFLIASIMLKKPDMIIFDNPFIGLDKATTESLNNFFEELALLTQLVFIVPSQEEIPRVATHVMPVAGMAYGPGMTVEDYRKDEALKKAMHPVISLNTNIVLPKSQIKEKEYDTVVKLEDITITYPKRVLFDKLNWTIKRGEKWALLGPNGSGKSTLLSLLSADNPRAYAQKVTLFDRRRGTGETIWEIKERIGFISSEMHLYFHADQSCLKIVSSGLFDTIGLYRKCTPEQESVALQWMDLFGVKDLAEQPYLKLSSGEQRLVLLARSMVKNPDLLILDEPMHGLDDVHKQYAKNVIENFCKQEGKSMIFVTHLKEEIPACVNKVFSLYKD